MDVMTKQGRVSFNSMRSQNQIEHRQSEDGNVRLRLGHRNKMTGKSEVLSKRGVTLYVGDSKVSLEFDFVDDARTCFDRLSEALSLS